MNTNFTNSNFGRILYVAIITLIVAATIFVIWYMTAGYKLGTYEPDTRLGSVYIGGLTEEEVPPRLNNKINNWYNDETITFELQYQGYSYSFDRDLFFFNVETSVSNIKQGEINVIQVYYQGNDVDTVRSEIESLSFLSDIIDNVDLQQVMLDILYDASLMKSYSIKNVEDYLEDRNASIETIETTDLILPTGFEMDTLVNKILEKYPEGEIVIPKEELFDVIDIFGDTMDNVEMTVLSSAMLELILETNFILNEVHATTAIPYDEYDVNDYPYSGRNAQIYEVTDESFSFYNPNTSEYVFTINDVDNTMSLLGLPFEYQINANLTFEVLPYVFEENLNPENHTEGHDGAIVQIEREIVKIHDYTSSQLIGVKIIVSEFYPPEKRINVFDLRGE